MNKPKILVIEDDFGIADFVRRGLCDEGFDAHVAHIGEVAIRKLSEGWDLIILDLMLPDLPGESILKYMGQNLDRPPVLVLTARSGHDDKIALFRQGCDDYLTKPFMFEELLERARALLRRAKTVHALPHQYEDIVLDSATFRLICGDKTITLTPKEFSMCQILLREPGKVISWKELLRSVWGLNREPNTNFLGVHLTHLRKKLAEVGKENWIQTVRSQGLVFSEPKEA
jgi:DNA-binding response OmpR family regulator